MPHTPSERPARRRLAAVVAVLTLLCVLLVPAVALGAEPFSPAPDPSATAEPTPTPTPTSSLTVSLGVAPAKVTYGQRVTVSGAVQPATAGQEVVVSLGGTRVASSFTDASGAYSLSVAPHKSGELVATLADGTRSDPTRVVVKPRVSISYPTPVPFANVLLTVKVAPAEYGGTVTAVVTHRGATVATVEAATRNGKAVMVLPLRGVGAFQVQLSLPAADGFAARTARAAVQVSGGRIATGSSGARVRVLLTQLARLKFRVPYIGSTFTSQCADAVVAFQKAYGLSRTYVFDEDDWRKLETAKVIKPKYSSPSTHLEVDKGRQIALVVKDGAVYGIIAVSTGATGNTPEGTFRIRIKSPYAPSNYGGMLFRSMGFYADFAMHGYAPVPPYPASHGCVREPMWVAQWMYDQSWVGETIYIYR
jgi:N-acetylmuramoyl-L-alanine amidase